MLVLKSFICLYLNYQWDKYGLSKFRFKPNEDIKTFKETIPEKAKISTSEVILALKKRFKLLLSTFYLMFDDIYTNRTEFTSDDKDRLEQAYYLGFFARPFFYEGEESDSIFPYETTDIEEVSVEYDFTYLIKYLDLLESDERVEQLKLLLL